MNLVRLIYSDLVRSYKEDRPRFSRSEKAAWLVFLATCLHLTSSYSPDVRVDPLGVRIVAPLLCTAALCSAILAFFAKPVEIAGLEIGISVGLLALVVLSSALSVTPNTSGGRAFLMLASGLGGYWCARILVSSENARRFLRAYCLILLVVTLVASFVSYYFFGLVHVLADSSQHHVTDRVLLLWFAPLALILDESVRVRAGSWILLISSYVMFYLSELRSMVLIPLVLAVISISYRFLKVRYVAMAFVVVIPILWYFFTTAPPHRQLRADDESIFYRVENYAFSFHIARQHPWLGIGLTCPRWEYLSNYDMSYPYVTKERFQSWMNRVTVSENIILTLMADLGFPFLLLYLGAVAAVVVRLARLVRNGSGSGVLPPLALLLPILGAMMHYVVWDGPLHVRTNWFFHMLLGLAVGEWMQGSVSKEERETDRSLGAERH